MDKLKQAREFFDAMDKPLDKQGSKGGMAESKTKVSRGSAGRESAERQRMRDRENRILLEMARRGMEQPSGTFDPRRVAITPTGIRKK